MNIMKIWEWLNGHKTWIGGALFLSAQILSKMAGIWGGETPPEWIPKVVETLTYGGDLFTTVGLLHKGAKQISGTNT